MDIQKKIRNLLWNLGYDLSKTSHMFNPLLRRKKIFLAYKIDAVLDIGANTGQFATQLRQDLGYKDKIVSFEPLSSAFKALNNNTQSDPNWQALNIALGDKDEERKINIASNSYSSSLLGMLPAHLKSAPESRYEGSETINVRKLDSIFPGLALKGNIYMKIDTQGFESKVLKGGDQSLSQIDTVQMEMSLVPLYEEELLFNELCGFMGSKGYTLIGIENGFSDLKSGQLLQVDGIFHRFSIP